jgi:[acyl-carrier-protein] S-malonyltransferase
MFAGNNNIVTAERGPCWRVLPQPTFPIMATAYVFPGQGAQFIGMGKDLYDSNPKAQELFEQANAILGFSITGIMFGGTEEQLKQTNVTQPAIFLHSVIAALTAGDLRPDMVAGHSLGEFSALVANGTLAFEDALRLVAQRADAMQEACEANPSTMAAILGLDDAVVEQVCAGIEGEVVVAANYNCPGQLVISGTLKGIEVACERMKEAGAKRAMPLPVGGAFHSPLMEPAREKLASAIEATDFRTPTCPVYQNVDAQPYTDPAQIKANLIAQLTAPVRWTQTVERMVADGAAKFVEVGPGKVLLGLVKKISREAEVAKLGE